MHVKPGINRLRKNSNEVGSQVKSWQFYRELNKFFFRKYLRKFEEWNFLCPNFNTLPQNFAMVSLCLGIFWSKIPWVLSYPKGCVNYSQIRRFLAQILTEHNREIKARFLLDFYLRLGRHSYPKKRSFWV